MQSNIDNIKITLSQLGFQLSENVWLDFASIWETSDVKRKTILTCPGEIENNLYFICDGVQRIYYFDEDEREATLILSYPYSFSGVVDSFLLQIPSKYYFETLSSSVVLKTTYEKFQSKILEYPELDSIFKKISIYALSGLLERMAELQCYSSEEKFKKLLKRSPQVLKLIPHKYLANYLGIDATNFSKLVNTIKI